MAARLDAVLPQTQCQRCGFDGCRPYAQALAEGRSAINRCPPGGARGIEQLAALLGVAVRPLDPDCGREADAAVAWIDAAACIGCARCLPPCPVDAILGAARYLHTVIESQCTGCELCIASCPVDCIQMRPRAAAASAPAAAVNRARYQHHRLRLERATLLQSQLLDERKRAAHATDRSPTQ
ncbi:MAG TPA: RnfABCDGE type electron transport complex subunit B [Steroidobacteraceae bacterium]